MKPVVIFILGPSAAGKSAVAARLAGKLKGEVISCDSMQVYKDMDVLTRPPGADLLSRAVHHLIGAVPPEEEYSAARFVGEAAPILASIISRGGVPIVAGGTGLYAKALIDGIFPSPPKDPEFRMSLEKTASEKGKAHLHRRLEKVDPETAGKLHPNDLRRVIRALEVHALTGRTIREKKMETEGISKDHDCRMFALSVPRAVLYGRIDAGVERMFEEGLVGEVKKLRERRLSLTAGKALGIKEVSSFLAGEASIEEATEELKENTRRYAKRQLSWFRADKRIVWVNAERSAEEITEDILGRLKER